MNTLTIADIKRRGMAAIEEGLRHGPVHVIKRNKPAAVVLSQPDYERLLRGQTPPAAGRSTALQWLLDRPLSGTRDKHEIDAALAAERDW
ncbi:MAG: hypothetical protein Q4G71_05715 [Pseudomonadota bacterium]|nr:hypothetical protein [Pseudomonadota bacterium]